MPGDPRHGPAGEDDGDLLLQLSELTSDLQNQAAGVEVVATRTVTGLQERLGGQVGIVDLYSGANVFICTYC